jgi:UDP-N-acetylglucosamine acyltransferase
MPVSNEPSERLFPAIAPIAPPSGDLLGSETAAIDPTARIEAGAEIGTGVTIGPYCIVGRKVVIGDGCKLVAHVHVAGHTTIGARTVIYPYASLGTPPQSTHYRGGPTRLVIGADCDIREGVTMNTGTEDGGGVTEVGKRGFFMANSHVGHDCRVGSDAVLANCVSLGGHCVLGDHVFIGGLTGVHQFTRIGAHAMISFSTGVRGDVIPFGLAAGAAARLIGINVVGMKRRKFSIEAIRAVRVAYRLLFFGKDTMARRLEDVEAKFGDNESVAQIVAFIRNGSHRPLCQAGSYQET